MYDFNPNSKEDPTTNHNSAFDDKSRDHHADNKKKINIKKNSAGHLPRELLKFAHNDSYSLLVKGKPGTGKTTLALTLMDNFNHDSNYFYISTRLSIKQLLYFYPWINKFTLKNGSKYEYKFEDARLDEPESLFERITNQLMDVKSPIIIIDTWDTIASFMDRESRLNNERVLQIWRERAGAKLIFLCESYNTTLLDSIVDGVITLKHEFRNQNHYRKLFIDKLRGIPIECAKYYFSIFNGLFFAFDTLNDLNLFEKFQINQFSQNKFVINKNKLINRYCKYQKKNNDFLIEAFNSNKLVTMEFDSNLNNELILSTLLKPLFCWIISNNLILINNFSCNFYSILKKIMLFLVDPELIDTNLLNEKLDFLKFTGGYKVSDEQNKLSLKEKKDGFENFKNSINEILSELSKKNKNNFNNSQSYMNVLNILNGNNLSHLFANFKFVDFIKSSSVNNLIILKNGSSVDTDVLLSESTYYKIVLKGKNIIIKSKNPPTHFFGAINERNNYFVDWCPMY